VEEVVAELTAKGGDVVACVGDVATETGGNAIVEQAVQQFWRLDAIVNNAGILNLSPFEKMSDRIFNETLDVNVRSAFYVTRAALPTWYGRATGGYLQDWKLCGFNRTRRGSGR
jgi:NAD(P)-dependent dehydrogenase (short-subunit alcohol dehydrogenase family)